MDKVATGAIWEIMMPKKPKMPKYVGLSIYNDGSLADAQPVYSISLTINPAGFGVSCDATNAEMVSAFIDGVRKAAVEKERQNIIAAEREVIARALQDAMEDFDDSPWSLVLNERQRPLMKVAGSGWTTVSITDWIERGLYAQREDR